MAFLITEGNGGNGGGKEEWFYFGLLRFLLLNGLWFEEWFFYPQITQMDTDKGTSAGWNLWLSVTSVDNNGFCEFVF